MRQTTGALLGAAMVLLASGSVAAQGITITPQLGAYIPASDFAELREEANQRRLDKSSTLGLGLAVELGWLRGSLAYASGATITDEGTQGEIGEGSLLVGAADLVLRPIPRLVIVQPYVLGGIGFRNASYDTSEATNIFPEDTRQTALHIGAGLDVMLGGIGLMAEVTDFISREPDDSWGQHDAFAMIGVRFALGR